MRLHQVQVVEEARSDNADLREVITDLEEMFLAERRARMEGTATAVEERARRESQPERRREAEWALRQEYWSQMTGSRACLRNVLGGDVELRLGREEWDEAYRQADDEDYEDEG